MKTKVELSAMTLKELQKEGNALTITGTGRMTKEALVAAILKAQKPAVQKPAESEEIVYTDLNEDPIEKGDLVDVRIGQKHFKGNITSLKVVESDQYAYVLLEGADKAKMFHTGDVKFLAKGDPQTESKPIIKTTSGGKSTYIAGEVAGGEDSQGPAVSAKPAKESKPPKDPNAVKEPRRKVIPEFTPEQKTLVDAEIKRFQDNVISKKELVVALMEAGIMKQQIDRFVDPKILNWSYVYDIYRAHGK